MGSDVYLKTKANQNCLHFAALGGHINLCKTLIENYGFDVCVTDNSGKSTLHNCAESGSVELFNYLVEVESEVSLKTTDGQNCLHFAGTQGSLGPMHVSFKRLCFPCSCDRQSRIYATSLFRQKW